MPTYQFECRDCGTQWEKVLLMREKKESRCPNCNKAGHRVFTVPRMSVDSKISPFDLNKLTQKTGNMKGNIGNLFDMAKELSEARGGEQDPIRKKALQDYANLRRGKAYRDPNQKVEIEFRVKSDPTTVSPAKGKGSKSRKGKVSK